MAELAVDRLLAPLGEASPCGADLAYDPAFVALEAAAVGRPEQQFGDKLIPAEEPDWRAVQEQALELAQRTRDLRVAVLLARSAAHVDGIGGYASALALIAGLLDQQWPHVHPMLDRDDRDDPTMRLNALAPLVGLGSGLADLRQAVVGSGRTAISVRQVELAFGKPELRAGEAATSPEGTLQALKAAEATSPGRLAAMRRVAAEVERIEALLAAKSGASAGPDLAPLRAVARCLATAAELAQAGSSSAQDPSAPLAAGVAGQASAAGAMANREDVIQTLERVCDWLARHEPTNPAPLLIRRAQRLMNKDFMEIIRDLVPDGVEQVEKIAGASNG